MAQRPKSKNQKPKTKAQTGDIPNLAFLLIHAKFNLGMSEEENNPINDSRVAAFLKWLPDLKFVKRVLVAIGGFSVLLVGIAMIVLPGPAFIVIPLGLAILATEFIWARKLLQKAKDFFKKKGACAECGRRIERRLRTATPPSTLCSACHEKSTEGKISPPPVPQISE